MAVTLTDKEFDFIYKAFEQLSSPYSTNEELAEAIALQIDIWTLLKELQIKRTAGAPVAPQSSEEPHSSLGRSFRSSSPAPK